MTRKPLLFLKDILNLIERIESYTNCGREEFLKNPSLQDATLFVSYPRSIINLLSLAIALDDRHLLILVKVIPTNFRCLFLHFRCIPLIKFYQGDRLHP